MCDTQILYSENVLPALVFSQTVGPLPNLATKQATRLVHRVSQ